MRTTAIGLVLLAGPLSVLPAAHVDRVRSEAAVAAPVPGQRPTAERQEPNDLTYDRVIEHLEARGHRIGQATETAAKMIGAEAGWRVIVDGHDFEIYVFDLHSEEGRRAFTRVKREGVFGVEPETWGNLAFFRSMKDPHPAFLGLVEEIRKLR